MKSNREKRITLIKQLMALEAAESSIKITSPGSLLPELLKFANRKQEEFVVVTLNGSNEVIRTRSISKGLVNRTLVHPREIFRPAIKDNAAALIIAHNHPSGSIEPSKEDVELTTRIKAAGELIGIGVLDHIIISKKGYYSFLEEGKF